VNEEPQVATPAPDAPAAPPHAAAAILPSEQGALAAELDELKDRHLRLVAEFDNFRKRVARERLELADRSQGALLGRLLDALDDLERALASDAATTTAEMLRSALDAVSRKLWKELGAAGLERVVPTGERFDPTVHEAIAIVPAPEGTPAQQVGATYQAGYRFKDQLLRPARVQVFGEAGQGG